MNQNEKVVEDVKSSTTLSFRNLFIKSDMILSELRNWFGNFVFELKKK